LARKLPEACIIALLIHDLGFSKSLDLVMQLLNDLFSFLHDGEIALMHFIGLEQVFHIDSLLDQDSNLLLIGVGIQFLLRDQLLQLNHFSSRLL